MKRRNLLSIIFRLIAAIIMLQTLYFKFTGQPESIYIFSRLGIDPWGRIGSGIAELAASLLLLWRPTVAVGALMGVGIMGGAITSHLLVLGIEVQDDGGQLFIYALVVLFCCISLLIMHYPALIQLKNRLLKRPSAH